MSGAEPPVGATSGSSAAVPSQQQQQEITAAQLSDAFREIIRHQQQQQEITAAQFSDAIREIIRQQQQQQEISAAQFSDAIREIIRNGPRSKSDELRGWLMLVATLTASITYSAALNPPGGFWQADDAKGPDIIPGTPVLSETFPRRYNAFYYSNYTSFGTSLCIIALSSTPSLYNRIQRSLLSNLVTLDLVALAVAFIAGSSIFLRQLIYGFGLLGIGLLCFMCFKFCGAPRHLDIDQSV
jgi:hypothetical protein